MTERTAHAHTAAEVEVELRATNLTDAIAQLHAAAAEGYVLVSRADADRDALAADNARHRAEQAEARARALENQNVTLRALLTQLVEHTVHDTDCGSRCVCGLRVLLAKCRDALAAAAPKPSTEVPDALPSS